MACLNCQKYFRDHTELELHKCINFYADNLTDLADKYHKLWVTTYEEKQ